MTEHENKDSGDELILFVDESLQSADARDLLRISGFPYRSVPASGPNVPAIKIGSATYQNLVGVERVIRTLNPEAYARYMSGDEIPPDQTPT